VGVKVLLVPVDCAVGFPYGHTVLEMENGGYWKDKLDALTTFEVPADFHCYVATVNHNHAYGKLDAWDGYGQPVFAVLAGELAKENFKAVPGELGRNVAVGAYIRALPKDTRIVVIYE